MSGYRGRGLHGQVVEQLGLKILSGEIGVGETLEIPGLEGELDVSRTVLREALKVLKEKGLVDARPKRGTFVQPRSEWRLLDSDVIRWQLEGDAGHQLVDDLGEFREVIEPASAGLAALRRTDDDLAAMESALEAMSAAAAGDGDPVVADLAFHKALLTATHNELLIRTEGVLEAALGYRDRLVHEAIPDQDPTESHAAVLNAIRDGDAEAAVTAAKVLVTIATVDVDRALSTRPRRRKATQTKRPRDAKTTR